MNARLCSKYRNIVITSTFPFFEKRQNNMKIIPLPSADYSVGVLND